MLYNVTVNTGDDFMLKDIKVFVADVDMTLVNDKKKLLPITKKAMELLREQGVYLGIASGRPIEGHLVRRSENWGFDRQFDFIIGMNGGQLHDYTDDTFVESYKLSRECVKEIIEIMEPLDLNPFVYEKGYMLAKRLDQQTIESSIRNDEPVQVVNDISEMWEKERNKIMFRAKTLEQMEQMVRFAKQHPSNEYQFFQTGPLLLEFQDPRINKSTAVEIFCKKHGITADEVIAFGDSSNDNEMMERAGLGVCLLNGKADSKAIADCITEYDSNHDGVGRFLEKHWFKRKIIEREED